MYHILREHYWWQVIKRDIARFVARCLTCQQVKAEHQRPAGESQPLSIPEWKWEYVTMDFVIGLPRTSSGYNSVWVIVDRLTKSAHFLPYKSTYSYDRMANLYIREIVRLRMKLLCLLFQIKAHGLLLGFDYPYNKLWVLN